MSIPSKKPWIWILHEDRALRSTLSYLCREEGLNVVELESLHDALAWLGNYQNEPQAVLGHFHLPDGDAEDFLLKCRQRFPGIPIYCLAADLPPPLADQITKAGIHVLPKPMSLGELLGILSSIKDEETDH